ncbi:MAG: ECF transporter S component [Chloroflexota bacterium]|nr:ECF transporter S component [Chloroflexota bacterium]MDQ6906946.1 ECF transporter S component [Chloroflexota bacterium]
MNRIKRWRTTIVLTVTSAIGVAAFLSPFWLARAQTAGADRTAHGGDAPLLFAVIGVLCLVVLLIETGGGADPDAKRVALLGVLVAANAALRLIPGVLGASPIFFLPICVGFVWGPSFGFLLGAASIAVSALLTGGIGPWLPFQMMTLGWVGMTAGVVGNLTSQPPLHCDGEGETGSGLRHFPSPQSSVLMPPKGHPQSSVLLIVFAALWGFGFGAIMNLWFWPFAAPASPAESGLYWAPGLGLGETVRRYLVFYGATSAVYDAFRAAGNVAMFALFGRPVLLLLLRFRDRFTWQPITMIPAPETHAEPGIMREG